jgi:imidazolonepropionase-like amidohydrolase
MRLTVLVTSRCFISLFLFGSEPIPAIYRLVEQNRLQLPAPLSWAFLNGLWFDGQSFKSQTVYAVDGRFTFLRPKNVDRTLDLKGTYVVPPFAEAHNHNLTSQDQATEMMPKYLKEGVFYAKMQSSMPLLTGQILHRFNRPESVDAVFANGPLTATGGHPVALRERLLERGMYPPGFTKETLNNQGYVLIDNESDLEKKWAMISGFRPDFIKAILVFSEEFEKRKDDPAYFGQKGLNPQLLPMLVTKVHAHGWTVSVHVNTAIDFHHAVIAGADEIAHLPGYSIPTYITPEDARLAAEKDVVVVTTTCLALKRKQQNDLYEKIRAAQISNLRLLYQSGVKIAIGSDDFEQTSLGEAEYLKELNVFDNRTLLKIWTENTVRTIFPKRKVGALREGYEASFLALSDDPIEDFANFRKISFRFKQGILLEP